MTDYKIQSNIEYKVEDKQNIERDSGSNSKLANSTSFSGSKNNNKEIISRLHKTQQMIEEGINFNLIDEPHGGLFETYILSEDDSKCIDVYNDGYREQFDEKTGKTTVLSPIPEKIMEQKLKKCNEEAQQTIQHLINIYQTK